MITQKNEQKNEFLEAQYERLEKKFVSYKDLCSIVKINDETDKEPFSTIPSIGNGVVSEYAPRFRELSVDLPNIIVRKTVYEKLQAVDAALKKKNPNLQIVVACGYRKLEYQQKTFEEQYEKLKPFHPDHEELLEAVHRTVAVPLVSGHPTGGAVDVWIRDFVKGEYLDFGTEIADYSTKDVYYSATGIRLSPVYKKLKPEVESNRKLIRSLMTAQGFAPYEGEWWHFSYGDIEWAYYTSTRQKRNLDIDEEPQYLYRHKNIAEIHYTEKYKPQIVDGDSPNMIRLAIQKEGRLTEETIKILNNSGIEITVDKRRFIGKCRDFPLELLFVRDDDIPNFVDAGIADLGIVGENIYFENNAVSPKLLELDFGHCSLALAVPETSQIKSVADLAGKRVATSYPKSTEAFLKRKNVDINGVEIIYIAGAVEVAPTLNYADAIIDIVSTGGSLRQNKLHAIETILVSQSILIANQNSVNDKTKFGTISDLLVRLKSYLSAKKYKQIMMSIPKNSIGKIADLSDDKRIFSINVTETVGDPDWCFARAIIKKSSLWDLVSEFRKNIGAKGIIFYDIEGIVE